MAFSLVFLGKVYAVLDINLEDNSEEKQVSVLVESYDTSVDRIEMDIMYSEVIVNLEISIQNSFRTIGERAYLKI